VEIGVWSGIHEVDGVRNAVFDRELNGVEVVAERLAELERIPLDACEQLLVVFGRVLDVALVMGPARIVGHDLDLALANDVAAEVLVEFDGLLVEHAEVARLIVCREEFRTIVDVVDIAPAAAIDGLHEAVLTDVFENRIPVERVFEIAHGALGGAFGMFLVRQDDGGRNGNAKLCGEGVVEEFVVGGPPEWIVDDDSSVECGVLEVGAIERDVVGDAVDDDRVWRGLIEVHGAGFNELGSDAIDVASVDVLDERAGKAVFHAEQNTDLFHAVTSGQ